jgi:hypothetical protein
MLLIDFESAVRREALSESEWQARCAADLRALLREALLLECRLGPQPGQFAKAAEAAVGSLFKDPSRILREIEGQTNLEH